MLRLDFDSAFSWAGIIIVIFACVGGLKQCADEHDLKMAVVKGCLEKTGTPDCKGAPEVTTDQLREVLNPNQTPKGK